jgi:hypothetical protein
MATFLTELMNTASELHLRVQSAEETKTTAVQIAVETGDLARLIEELRDEKFTVDIEYSPRSFSDSVKMDGVRGMRDAVGEITISKGDAEITINVISGDEDGEIIYHYSRTDSWDVWPQKDCEDERLDLPTILTDVGSWLNDNAAHFEEADKPKPYRGLFSWNFVFRWY